MDKVFFYHDYSYLIDALDWS